MEKRAQQESGEERVTAKSRPMMNLTARTLSVVTSSASSNPVRTSYGFQGLGKSAPSDDRTVKPVQPSQPDFSKEDYGRSWSSQEWKSGAAKPDRSGKPEEISWDTLQKVDLHREEHLLGRNAHSARYGELIPDRTGKPVSVHHQEQAYSENFVMGSDAAEFVNKVKDQVWNRQKRMSNVAESGDEHSIIWWMFMATTLNAATFMGKTFSTIQSVVKNHESLTLKQMFDVRAQLSEQSGRNQLPGQNSVGKEFLDTSVINWWWNSHQSSRHKSLCNLGFCVVPRKGSSTSRIQRSLEEQSCRNPIREMLQRLWCYQWRVDWIRVEHFPRIHDVAALWWNQWSSEQFGTNTSNFHRKNSICVNVQWHLLWQKRQQRWMFKKCRICEGICEKIWYWAMVIYWTRFWKEVVFFREQSTRSLGQHCGANVAGICRKWASYFPCNDSIVQGYSQEQRARKIVYTLRCRSEHNWQFIALFFLSISSVSTEQWQLYAKNLSAIKIDRVNLGFWWVNQLFLAKSKQKLFCTTTIPWMTKLYGSSTFNKLNRFHQKTKWVSSLRMQDWCVLLKLDNISWPRTLVILDNFAQWLVANTLYLEMIQFLNQKDGSKEIWELDLYWKSPPVFSTSNMELKFELSPLIKTILILGSEFLLERSTTWSILFKTTQKFLQICKKSKFYKQAQAWLQPGQRQNQNINQEYSLGRQQPYQYMKEDGLTLNHQNKILPRTISRRKSLIFFDTIRRYIEKKMEQLNSTR